MAIENSKLTKFTSLLKELFQLNQPELDFGIYRIMHARKDDINRFIEQDLPKVVNTAFSGFASQDKVVVQQELVKAKKAAEDAGFDASQSPKVQELEAQLSQSVDTGREEGEVYDALLTFFSRYYDEGDFISRRVYKEGTYVIPYSGEEVSLHWANKDQYYIKSSESLRDFCFRLKSEQPENPMRVHFRVIDAEAGAQNNNKEADDAKRVFILDQDKPWEVKDNELNIYFYYRVSTQNDWTDEALSNATAAAQKKPPTLDHLKQIAEHSLLSLNGGVPNEWRQLLVVKYKKTDGELADYSVLMSQLNLYTKKNTFDYFIHKNLSEFLTRELDFYIKNELFRWEDISNMKSNPARLAPLLSKIEVIRTIGEKIITFLAQLEDFQKKLWLKKKFVTETNYCITLDRLAEQADLLAEIIVNDAQRQQWHDLVDLDLIQLEEDVKEGDWITRDKYRYLMIDTAMFGEGFKARLLAQIDGLDEQTDGLFIHSDNFQALELIRTRYEETIKCVYIDPPYNTGKDGFMYKDNYQHSSWISMVEERIRSSYSLLKKSGAVFVSIDEKEHDNLRQISKSIFGEKNLLADFIWLAEGNYDNQAKIKMAHEYVLGYAISEPDFLPPPVIDPSAPVESKLFRSEIRNTIIKNGSKNPISPIVLPEGFPAAFKEGTVNIDEMNYPQYSSDIIVENYKLKKEVVAESGWSSKSMCEAFINNDMHAVYDKKGQSTTFVLTKTGAIESIKKRAVNQSYVTSILKGVGTIQSTSAMLEDMNCMYPNYPKPPQLISYLASMTNCSEEIVLDYYAGSGSTGHAIINLNRQDDGKRKYILVEMGTYFDTVIKPRMQKVVYSPSWKNGCPVANKNDSFNGISHCFKYIRLESYDDTLANLQLKRTPVQNDLLSSNSGGEQSAREAYLLNYMLNVETQGSASLLDISMFVDPTAYQLKVRNPTGDETKLINVDLLETFNWLIGLTVENISAPIHFSAELKQAEHGRWQADVKRQTDGQWWFRTVAGTNRKGQKVLIVWRNLPSVIADESNGLVMDNAVLDAVLIDKLSVRMTESQDDEFDVLYVNGDHNITIPKNRQGGLMESRVKLIEEDFHRLMFSSVEH